MSDEVQLLESEVESATLFLALGTQWRVHPMMGVRLGLDYQAIGAAAAMLAITISPAIFHDLRMMESAAVAETARKAARR